MILRIQPLDQVGGWWQIAEKPFRRDDALTSCPNAAYDSACPRSGNFSEQPRWGKSKGKWDTVERCQKVAAQGAVFDSPSTTPQRASSRQVAAKNDLPESSPRQPSQHVLPNSSVTASQTNPKQHYAREEGCL